MQVGSCIYIFLIYQSIDLSKEWSWRETLRLIFFAWIHIIVEFSVVLFINNFFLILFVLSFDDYFNRMMAC